MSFCHNQITDFGVSDVELWEPAFTIGMTPAAFGRLLDQIEVRATNIFTGKLPATRSFCEALERRQISTLGGVFWNSSLPRYCSIETSRPPPGKATLSTSAPMYCSRKPEKL